MEEKDLEIKNQIKKAMEKLPLPLETDITVTYSQGKDIYGQPYQSTLDIPKKEGNSYYKIFDVIYGYSQFLTKIDEKRAIKEILISESQTIYVPWNGALFQFSNREQAILYFLKCLIAIQENKRHPYATKLNQIEYTLRKLKKSSDKVIYPDITDEALLFYEVVEWSESTGTILADKCSRRMSIDEYWKEKMEKYIAYGK